MLFVPRDEVRELEMNIDEAMRLVISVGVAAPEWPRRKKEGGAGTRNGQHPVADKDTGS